MRTFATYFTYHKVLFALAAKRIALSARRHDDVFLNNIIIKKTKGFRPPASDTLLSETFPPRNTWVRLSKDKRMEFAGNPQQALLKELCLTVNKEKATALKTGIVPDWLKKLNGIISDIRDSMKEPANLAQIKPVGQAYLPKNKTTKEHRVIVKYSLIDGIISTLVTEYLTDHTDTASAQPYFSISSYAFRSSRLAKKGGQVFSYHTATSDIVAYRARNICKGIYVAEVDLEKFFDSVNHLVLLQCLDKMTEHFNSLGKPLDQRAVQIARNYLDSFSFNRDALPNEITGKRIFKWPAQKLQSLGVDIQKEKIGVAQGGALSCFFANLIMHELDSIFQAEDTELSYLRYCDDFIILHTDQDRCRKYVEAALEKIKELKLVAHSPNDYELVDYKKRVPKKNGTREVNEFWYSSKSKNPYKWGPYDSEHKTNVPYVSFVGYQRRYDGLLRVRKKSLKKEYQKQKKLVDDVLERINSVGNGKIKLYQKQIIFRAEQKLIAMSVGKKNIYNADRTLGFCWCHGFKEMNSGTKKSNAQLKYLDRSRERQLGRLRGELRKLRYDKTKPRKGKEVETLHRPLTSYFAYFNQRK